MGVEHHLLALPRIRPDVGHAGYGKRRCCTDAFVRSSRLAWIVRSFSDPSHADKHNASADTTFRR